MQSQKWHNGLCSFPRQSFNITAIQIYALISIAEEAEVEQFYKDLQDLVELTPKKDVLFIRGDWNAKVRSQEIPGAIGKFGLVVQNETGQRLTEFCQENTLVIANTLYQEKTLHMDTTRWSIPKSDWLYSFQLKMEKLYIVRKKKRPGTGCGSDHELLIAKFRLKLKKLGENH